MHALETQAARPSSPRTRSTCRNSSSTRTSPSCKSCCDAEFEAALFKGRQNYLCPRRLTARPRSRRANCSPAPSNRALEQIHYWSLRTTDGSLSDLPREPEHNVWQQVCSEAHVCTPKSCGPDSGCFYQAARRKVQRGATSSCSTTRCFSCCSARRWPTQHAKAAADVENEQADADEAAHGGYLFEDDFVIFDEAHTVEAVGGQADRPGGFAVRPARPRCSGSTIRARRRACGPCCATRKACARRANCSKTWKRSSHGVDRRVDFKRGGRECRVREPDLVPDTLGPGLDRVRGLVADAAVRIEDDDITRAELGDLGRRLVAARDGIATFIDQSADNHVYWVERTGKTESNLSLHAAPIDLSEILGEDAVPPEDGTRRHDQRDAFRGQRRRWDISASASARRARASTRRRSAARSTTSKQMKLYLTPRMPETPREPGYEEALAKWIEHFIGADAGPGVRAVHQLPA